MDEDEALRAALAASAALAGLPPPGEEDFADEKKMDTEGTSSPPAETETTLVRAPATTPEPEPEPAFVPTAANSDMVRILRGELPPPLDEYAEKIVVDGGLYELSDLHLIDEEMLPELGILKPLHRKRMMKFLRSRGAAPGTELVRRGSSGPGAETALEAAAEVAREVSAPTAGSPSGAESPEAKRSVSRGLGAPELGHVMISYSWSYQPTVLRMRDCLRAAGFKVWCDVDHMRGDLVEAMASAVEGAEVVLVCFSASYAQSVNCTKELRFAMHRKKRIIPCRMEEGYELTSGALAFALAGLLYYDFSDESKFTASVKQLVRAVAEHFQTLGEAADPSDAVARATSAGTAAIRDRDIDAAVEETKRHVDGFKEGDRVRVKASIITPRYDWGLARPGDVGAVTEVDEAEDTITVNFPAHHGWRAAISDMEHAPGGGFDRGDVVRIRPDVREPKLGWGPLAPYDVGRVSDVVNIRLLKLAYPGVHNFSAAPGDLELFASEGFQIGDAVRVKPGTEPRLGWGSVSEGEVGRIARFLSKERVHVNFRSVASWLGWTGFLEDLERVPGGGFEPGDQVYIPTWVKKPHGAPWGGAVSTGSRGEVVAADGQDEVIVMFEDGDGPSVAHPRDLAYLTTPFGISVGDHVTRNPDVPGKYGDGGVEIGTAGEVVFVETPWKCFVRFHSHSWWHSGVEDLVKLPFGGFEVGMVVKFRPWFKTPRMGKLPPGVTYDSHGKVVSATDDDMITVEFKSLAAGAAVAIPEHEGAAVGGGGLDEPSNEPAAAPGTITARIYQGDLEYAGQGDITVGAVVRVRPDLPGEPTYGWGPITATDRGLVTKVLDSDTVLVDFDKFRGWRGNPQELMLAE